MSDTSFMSLSELARGIRSGAISSVQIVEDNLARIDQLNPELNIFTRVTGEDALAQAEIRDAEAKDGKFRGPLHGLTVAVKDLIDVQGYTNSAGSAARQYADPATHNATSVERLLSDGAIVIGLTNLHEWAYGGTSVNPTFGPVGNPWMKTHIPGGSSGGSAAAVLAGMASFAVGTDTGGSVRIPASLCGVAGIKTTLGQIPTTGVMPLAWSLDTVGPIGRSVADLLDPYASMAVRQSASADPIWDDSRLRGSTVGIAAHYYADEGRTDPEVYQSFQNAVEHLKALGVRVQEVEMPSLRFASPAQYAILLSEGASIHDGDRRADRAAYGEDVRRLLAIGDTMLAQDYLAALRYRTEVARDFNRVFSEVDFLISPTTPHVATPIELQELMWPNGESESLLDAIWRNTFPSNLAGLPSSSQPCGMTRAGLPIGLQVIGPADSEWDILGFAAAVERTAGWSVSFADNL